MAGCFFQVGPLLQQRPWKKLWLDTSLVCLTSKKFFSCATSKEYATFLSVHVAKILHSSSNSQGCLGQMAFFVFDSTKQSGDLKSRDQGYRSILKLFLWPVCTMTLLPKFLYSYMLEQLLLCCCCHENFELCIWVKNLFVLTTKVMIWNWLAFGRFYRKVTFPALKLGSS